MTPANQIIHLFGSARSSETKTARRMDRFGNKAFSVGGVPIRSGRRTTVSFNFLEAHLDMIIAHVERGALRCQLNSDSFLTTKELRALFAAPILAAPDENSEGGEQSEPQEEEQTEESQEDLPEEPQEPAEEESEQSEEPAEEHESEEDTSSQDDSQDESGGESEAMEMAALNLPDAWRTRNKKGLLALCVERKLTATDKLSNRDLISLLESWNTNR